MMKWGYGWTDFLGGCTLVYAAVEIDNGFAKDDETGIRWSMRYHDREQGVWRVLGMDL